MFFFGAHFALIGAFTGAAMCALSFVQLTAAGLRRSRLSAAVFRATVPAMAVLAALTWSGAAVAGLALGTLGRWQQDARRLRWFFLGASLGWAAHNLLVMSPFGLTTDALALATNGWRLRRTRKGAGAARAPVPVRDAGSAAGSPAGTGRRTTMRGWMLGRAERQAQLMGRMMERLRVDPAAAALRARAFAAAGRRCLWCGASRQCGRWLEEGGGSAPSFCPNARFFAEAALASAARGR